MRDTSTSHAISRKHRTAGFTLLELLVVLVILGLLAAVATPQVLNYLARARTQSANIQINNLAAALDLFRLDVGRYPTNEEGLPGLLRAPQGVSNWFGPYVKRPEMLNDPWGRPYKYRIPGEGRDFDLYTFGQDDKVGGEGENRDVSN